MTRALGFSDAVFGFGAGIFFAGYFLLEIPGGILAELWSARKWIARILISWGFVASLTGLIHTAQQFYWIRFSLGVAEAGFVPGMLVYLSHWYRPEDRGKAMAMFFASVPASQVLGRTAGCGATKDSLAGSGRLALAAAARRNPCNRARDRDVVLSHGEASGCKWLRPEEREWLAGELEKEQAAKTTPGSVLRALGNPHVLLLGVILFLSLNSTYGVSLWLPKMVQRLSTSRCIRP